MNPPPSLLKAALRQRMKDKRRDFVETTSPDALAALHKNIINSVLQVLRPLGTAIISGYWPLNEEFDIRPLMEEAVRQGWTLCLPVVDNSQPSLIFRHWRPGIQLVRGTFGVMIPPATVELCQPDVLCLPLLACDKEGHRLGYGQGHFDRTLAALRAHKKIMAFGFGYECQYIDLLPQEPTDQPLDGLVTEQRVIRFNHETSLLW